MRGLIPVPVRPIHMSTVLLPKTGAVDAYTEPARESIREKMHHFCSPIYRACFIDVMSLKCIHVYFFESKEMYNWLIV